jgi:predicted DCC family thiol-disulfide oxidoreductase YuxK
MAKTLSKSNDPACAVEAFYDGACPLCRAEIEAYRRMPGGGAIAWRDVAAGEAPPEIGVDAALARFHVRRADGALASGFGAFLAIWRANPRLAPLARALDRAPILWLGDRAYAAFLRLRPLWRRPQRRPLP